MKKLVRTGLPGAACVVAMVTVGAQPASAVPTAPDVSEHFLIGTVTGDSLADILERSEPLNEPGQLAPYLDSLAAHIASGEVGEALGLENLPVEEALVLVADAKESIATDQPFSDAVENFRAVSEAEAEYVQDAPDGVVAAPFSSDDPSTPSEYNVWGEAYNSNRSWKLDSTFKLQDCMPFCQDIDKLVVTTVVDPGQFATRVTHNQLYFPSEMGYFSSPEITGKIYLPTAPAAAERTYMIVNNTGEFFYPHPDTAGTTFIMGFKVATPTDSGEYWVVKPRTLTATCGTGIDGVCQWWV